MPSTSSVASGLAIHGAPASIEPALTDQRHGAADLGEPEIEAVARVIRHTRLWRYSHTLEQSTVGRCEARLAGLAGVPHVLVVGAGGTGALIAGLIGLGVGPGDEVIVPGYTYIATASAVVAAGAVPVLAEIDDTLTLDPADFAAKISPRTKAVIPVHMRGTPADMGAIMQIARSRGLRVLEDVAQACGATIAGQWCGTFGDAGAFSFQYYKLITAGEGGALLTGSREVFERACMHHDSAMQYWEKGQSVTADFAGENYRMSELNGAILEVQLGRLEGILAANRRSKSIIVNSAGRLHTLRWQRQIDPDGDAAVCANLLAPDPKTAGFVAAALRAEGAAAGTSFDKTIPDRHVYRYWEYLQHHRSSRGDGRPWTDPAYVAAGGDPAISYAQTCLPRTLNLLERTVSLPVHQHVSDATARATGEAIARIDAWLSTQATGD